MCCSHWGTAHLLLIAKWNKNDNKDSDYYSKKSDELLDRVKKQDWYQIVSSNNYRTQSFAATIFSFILLGIIRVLPPFLVILAKKATYWKKKSVKAAFIYNVAKLSRVEFGRLVQTPSAVDDRMIVHPIISGRLTDYKMSSTLFELWESIRLNSTRDNLATMIKYLEFLSVGKFQQYEEIFYYKSRHKTLK